MSKKLKNSGLSASLCRCWVAERRRESVGYWLHLDFFKLFFHNCYFKNIKKPQFGHRARTEVVLASRVIKKTQNQRAQIGFLLLLLVNWWAYRTAVYCWPTDTANSLCSLFFTLHLRQRPNKPVASYARWGSFQAAAGSFRYRDVGGITDVCTARL